MTRRRFTSPLDRSTSPNHILYPQQQPPVLPPPRKVLTHGLVILLGLLVVGCELGHEGSYEYPQSPGVLTDRPDLPTSPVFGQAPGSQQDKYEDPEPQPSAVEPQQSDSSESDEKGEKFVDPPQQPEPDPGDEDSEQAGSGQPTSPQPTPTEDQPPPEEPGESEIEAPEEEETDTQLNSSEQQVSSVSFVMPFGLVVTSPLKLQVSVEGPVASVEYTLDGQWSVGQSSDKASGFKAVTAFNQGGMRTIEAKAFDASGNHLASASKTSLFIAPASDGDGGGGNDGGGDTPNNAGEQETTTTAPAAAVAQCEQGRLPDCNGNCAKIQWLHDGYCDDGGKYIYDFTCPALGMDGTDCGLQAQSPCEAGRIPDCLGQCAKVSWLGDGVCDDGKQYKFVLTCPELGNDGGDCVAGGNQSAPAPPSNPGSPPPANNGPTGGLNGVPYFYQFSNALHPGTSCQNTSIAMVLAWLGWTGVPDDITATWGKNKAQVPAGLAQVANSYLSSMGSSASMVANTNGSISGLQGLLAAGKPVIIHGYFTSAGHVVVVTGYDGVHYTVNDPAGQWNQAFKGGYPYGGGSSAGKGVKYGKAAFEQAISTLNGSTYAPLWYHELNL